MVRPRLHHHRTLRRRSRRRHHGPRNISARSAARSPYNVAYVQPSRRPADGRYGENPNRLYKHQQLQVILKPSPADVIDQYLGSLAAIGIDLAKHDIKFEEDNWEAPTLGAWGIGWQVMLDGMEITQFTYFQQCGGFDLDLVPAELTYGLERIVAFLQNVDSVYDIEWAPGVKYGAVRNLEEYQFSKYNFELADVRNALEALRSPRTGMPTTAQDREPEAVLPAYDYVLKCSHIFNLLDSRGAISVTERVGVIARVRKTRSLASPPSGSAILLARSRGGRVSLPFLLEIGTEEIPDWMIVPALNQLQDMFQSLLDQNSLGGRVTRTDATPRRLVLRADGLTERQPDTDDLMLGPPKSAGQGAATGFAKKMGTTPDQLGTETTAKGEYFSFKKRTQGQATTAILARELPNLILKIAWPKTMYWNGKGTERFIRPIRWLVASFSNSVVPFQIAGVQSGTATVGHRLLGKTSILVTIADFDEQLRTNGVIVSAADRRAKIENEIAALLNGQQPPRQARPRPAPHPGLHHRVPHRHPRRLRSRNIWNSRAKS